MNLPIPPRGLFGAAFSRGGSENARFLAQAHVLTFSSGKVAKGAELLNDSIARKTLLLCACRWDRVPAWRRLRFDVVGLEFAGLRWEGDRVVLAAV